MRTVRVILWRRGGMLMGAGVLMIAFAASRWGEGSLYPVLGPMMLFGLGAAAAGAIQIGEAVRQVAIREILRLRSLRVRVDAAFVAKRKRGTGYYVWAKCMSPVICEEIWVKSPLLMDDPTPYLKNGVDVLFDSGYHIYYVLAEELGEGNVAKYRRTV